MPPKPVKLPVDAVEELLLVADSLDAQSKTWSPRNARGGMKRWLEGMRRGYADAAQTCRRRARRIQKARAVKLGWKDWPEMINGIGKLASKR